MITFVRKLTAPVMIFLLVVVGISFVFFGNWTSKGDSDGGPIGKVDGRKIYPDEFRAAQRSTQVAYLFRTGREFDRGSYGEEFLVAQTWNRMIILAEARRNGLKVTDEQVLDAIKKCPIFLDKDAFSGEYFKRFSQNYLSPMGVSMDLFEQIIREELEISMLIEDISKTAVVRPGEAEEAYSMLFGKLDVQIVNIPVAKIKASIKPTDGEIKAYYEKNVARYSQPEKRKFEYTVFALAEKDQKLPEKEKNKALEELGKKAFAFTGKFLSLDDKSNKNSFSAECQKEGLRIQSTDFVGLDQPPALPAFKSSQVLNAGFDLTPENAVSDYLPIENGFVILHLLDVKPSEPLAFDQVKKQAAEDFVEEESRPLLVKRGKEIRDQIAAKLAAGAPFEKAASEAGEKAEALPSFIPVEARNIKVPGANIIVFLAQRLKVGEVSTFESYGAGGMIVYLKARSESDDKKKAEFLPLVERDLYQQRRQQMVQEWVLSKLNTSRNKTPSDLIAMMQRGQ